MKALLPATMMVEGGYAGWRSQALRALSAGWPPEALTWVARSGPDQNLPAQGELAYAPAAPVEIAGSSSAGSASEGAGPLLQIRVSQALAGLLQDAALYRSATRWAFLYRVLWRWQHGDRTVASAADEDGARLHAMAKAVRRAKHDMIAYVRFRQREGDGFPAYLAWYEPDHDVLAYAAAHFARRMGRSSWCIGTPQGAALWDGQALRLTDVPADADAMRVGTASDQVEPLWLLYYQSIFNPARLNESALQQRMPVRFWKHLPEGPLIPAMIVEARNGTQRSGQARAVGRLSGKHVAVDAQRVLPQRTVSALDQCRRCTLWQHATQAVAGEGADSARLMLVGEQPGDHEDLSGRVFIGPAGQVLDEALQRAGVSREDIFLTNAVKHFKWMARGKQRVHKTPAQHEVEACAHWLAQERARVRPAVIVTLGATALTAIVGRGARLQDYLGEPVWVEGAWLLATWHPAYALRVGTDDAGRARVVADISSALERARQLAEAASEAP